MAKKANPKVARDEEGPNGHLRLKIPLFDEIVDFQELARQRELRKADAKAMIENKNNSADLRIKLVGVAESVTDQMGETSAVESVQNKFDDIAQYGEAAFGPEAEIVADEVKAKSRRMSAGSSSKPPQSSDSEASSASDECVSSSSLNPEHPD